ncbi:MAG: aspartate/glutamate racemase family protein, partial [Firmicutes bacterium]|nr:aspartate/glutamate racemase family protein [Bacillota bacterium]
MRHNPGSAPSERAGAGLEARDVTGVTVGLFDSGVGGLSVLRHMLDCERPPWTRIVYLADLAHFPYGPLPPAEVRRLALAGVRALAAEGAALVAIACNTAASSGIRTGAVDTPVPIVDIIGPGARQVGALAKAGQGSRAIVLGTEGTVRSRVWERALREEGHVRDVTGWPCPFLASLIEEGRNGYVARRAVLEAVKGLALSPPGQAGPHLVVLGCTHYPFAADTFEKVLREHVLHGPVRIVDPSGALAVEVASRLRSMGPGKGRATGPGVRDPIDRAREGLEESSGERPSKERPVVEVVFRTTGRTGHFRRRARQLLADRLAGDGFRLRLDEVKEITLAAAVNAIEGPFE